MLKIPLRGIDRTGTAKNAGSSWLVLPCFLLFPCLQETMKNKQFKAKLCKIHYYAPVSRIRDILVPLQSIQDVNKTFFLEVFCVLHHSSQ